MASMSTIPLRTFNALMWFGVFSLIHEVVLIEELKDGVNLIKKITATIDYKAKRLIKATFFFMEEDLAWTCSFVRTRGIFSFSKSKLNFE